MLRIAQFTKYGDLAASTRQRFDQYDTYLSGLGCRIEKFPLLNNSYLERLYKGDDKDVWGLAKQYLNRAKHLFKAKNFDVIWINYEVFPYLPEPFERLLLKSGIPIVFDLDDAIFHNYDLHRSGIVRKLLGGKLRTGLTNSAMVFCGNQYLADYASRYCSKTPIVPTVLDTSVFLPIQPVPALDKLTVGWIGSPTTWDEYVKPILPTLSRVMEDMPATMLAVGGDQSADQNEWLELRPWSEQTEVSDLQQMDVGIMPLNDTPWARGKCGYKLIQYMACGLPVVASPVGVNCDIVDQGINGFLANTPQEWSESLRTLNEDSNLRQSMGENGRNKIVARYSLDNWGPKVFELLSMAAGSSAT